MFTLSLTDRREQKGSLAVPGVECLIARERFVVDVKEFLVIDWRNFPGVVHENRLDAGNVVFDEKISFQFRHWIRSDGLSGLKRKQLNYMIQVCLL